MVSSSSSGTLSKQPTQASQPVHGSLQSHMQAQDPLTADQLSSTVQVCSISKLQGVHSRHIMLASHVDLTLLPGCARVYWLQNTLLGSDTVCDTGFDDWRLALVCKFIPSQEAAVGNATVPSERCRTCLSPGESFCNTNASLCYLTAGHKCACVCGNQWLSLQMVNRDCKLARVIENSTQTMLGFAPQVSNRVLVKLLLLCIFLYTYKYSYVHRLCATCNCTSDQTHVNKSVTGQAAS